MLFEGGLKSSQASHDATVEFEQMWFIFQHSPPPPPPPSPHITSIGVAALGFPWYTCVEALILIFKKVLNCKYDGHLIIGLILLPSQC